MAKIWSFSIVTLVYRRATDDLSLRCCLHAGSDVYEHCMGASWHQQAHSVHSFSVSWDIMREVAKRSWKLYLQSPCVLFALCLCANLFVRVCLRVFQDWHAKVVFNYDDEQFEDVAGMQFVKHFEHSMCFADAVPGLVWGLHLCFPWRLGK